MGLCPKPRFILLRGQKNGTKKKPPVIVSKRDASGLPAKFKKTRFAQTLLNFSRVQS
jgi:hypothetical protein